MTAADTLLELMRTRRSVRSFTVQVPDDETVERVLDAAILAPSASNKQPWRFLVVRAGPVLAAMATAVRDALTVVAQQVQPDHLPALLGYGSYFSRFEDAPVVIIPIFRGAPLLTHMVSDSHDVDLQERVALMERDSALMGVSLAVGHMLLAAHAMGLGASAMTGPLLAAQQLTRILTVPQGWDIAALVALGYTAEVPSPTDRKSVRQVTRWIS